MMKKRKVVGASIVCLFIVAIAIHAILGGGIGLKIDPPEAQVKPDSTIIHTILQFPVITTTASTSR